MTHLSLWIAGTPKAQPRVRAFRRGRHASVYTPDSADAWKAAVRAAVLERTSNSTPFLGPVSLRLEFVLPRPKRLKGTLVPHASKPDIDNLVKAVMDAMGDCGVWADDAQVAELHASKQYAEEGGDTGCDVTVTPCGPITPLGR